MKKWLLPIVVLVFCVLMGVYYYLGTKPVAPWVAPVFKQANPSATVRACLKMPPEKIWAAHKTPSGYSFPGMGYEKLREVYRLMTGYYTCLAAGSHLPRLCDNLPADCEYAADQKAETLSPRTRCADEYRIFAFSAYMAGKSKSDTACKDFLASDRLQGGLPEQEFCRVASGGMENICTSLYSKGKLPVEMEECHQIFPEKSEDCLNSANCLQMWQIYKAVSSGGTADRWDYYQPMAAAYLQKSSRRCQEIADKLANTYCEFQNESIGKKQPAHAKLTK